MDSGNCKQSTGFMTNLIFLYFKKSKWWAFKQMGSHTKNFKNIEGLTFYKMLGTGSDPGFSMYPDFSTYALLLNWQDEAYARKYFNSNLYFNTLLSQTYSFRKVSLACYKSVGKWDNTNPFSNNAQRENTTEMKVGVITRATIHFGKLIYFWRSVKSASDAISNAKGVSFFKGIGELPFIQQATFSIWDSESDINNFAYSDTKHKKIVEKTRKQNWYSEDLFARFHVLKDSGIMKTSDE